jgi:hypothetical protein
LLLGDFPQRTGPRSPVAVVTRSRQPAGVAPDPVVLSAPAPVHMAASWYDLAPPTGVSLLALADPA